MAAMAFPQLHYDSISPFFIDNVPSPFLYSDSDFFPYFPDNPISTAIFPSDSDHFHFSKRHKLNFDFDPNHLFSDGDYFPVPWDISPAPSSEAMEKLISNKLSAQTIAARERRRKITAKTKELGELIPGGAKLNTADMFHSAFKYVKFLQAQVSILQLWEEMAAGDFGELQILESPMIQEKLCLEETCLVPEEFVRNIADFPEIQSNLSLFNAIINQVLQTGGGGSS